MLYSRLLVCAVCFVVSSSSVQADTPAQDSASGTYSSAKRKEVYQNLSETLKVACGTTTSTTVTLEPLAYLAPSPPETPQTP